MQFSGLTAPEPVAQLKAAGKPNENRCGRENFPDAITLKTTSGLPGAIKNAWLIADEFSVPPHPAPRRDDLRETFAAIS